LGKGSAAGFDFTSSDAGKASFMQFLQRQENLASSASNPSASCLHDGRGNGEITGSGNT